MAELSNSVTAEPLVSVQGLSIQYRASGGTVQAVDDVSFELAEGEFLSVIGPSGCGKSSMLRVVAHLLAPSQGTVRVLGEDWSKVVPEHLSMMFQSPVLLDWRKVLRNISFPLEFNGTPKAEAREQARSYLDSLGLTGFANALPHQLSGGMQQRVALGRAMITDPKLMLMDEPFGALDALTRDRMGEFLQSTWLGKPSGVIFVTHGISEAVVLSNRVLVMSRRPGRIVGEVKIDLPLPRDEAVRNSEQFHAYEAELRSLLEDHS